ncbi:MAG: hypothetical protein HQ511_14730 [Rhodospirillales bacterium]|nr:hypothetical protein [Rhodospirillales bacterium]
MNGFKICAVICLVALVVGIAGATMADPMLTGFFEILDQPTGWPFVVTLDLMVGFLFLSFMIYFVEGDVAKTLYWAVPLFILGNVVSAVYLIVNLNKIRGRLSGAAE